MGEQANRGVPIPLAGLGAAIAAALVALLLWFEACEEEPTRRTEQVAAEPTVLGRSTTSTTTDADPGADRLCALHADREATVAAIGTVDGPPALEATIRAQITFYGSAAEVVDPADAPAFLAMLEYFDARRRFHEPRGWNPRVELAEAGQVPAAPPGAGARTQEVLEARCGVVVVPDSPG